MTGPLPRVRMVRPAGPDARPAPLRAGGRAPFRPVSDQGPSASALARSVLDRGLDRGRPATARRADEAARVGEIFDMLPEDWRARVATRWAGYIADRFGGDSEAAAVWFGVSEKSARNWMAGAGPHAAAVLYALATLPGALAVLLPEGVAR